MLRKKIWSAVSKPDFPIKPSKKLFGASEMEKIAFFHPEKVNKDKICF